MSSTTTFNLLDTPGHEFLEDTYRTLTVDSAVMVIDAAKGIEERTQIIRGLPPARRAHPFINKMDREARDCLSAGRD